MRVMSHSHTLAASQHGIGLRVCMGACTVGGGTTQTAAAAVAAYQLSQPL